MEFAQTEKIEQMAQQIIERAQLLQQQKMQQQTQDRPAIVAIDGRCASGKTTLCSFIEQKTGYTVLHLDHFFLQPHQRTPQRLAQPGGNVDYERFWQQVMVPLRQGVSFSYRPYDCSVQQWRCSRPLSSLWKALTAVIRLCGKDMICISF